MGTNSKLGPQILAAFAGICFERVSLEIVQTEIIIFSVMEI